MSRPRLLLVPALTELEWVIRPLLEAWADVAFFDAPGVGGEPAPDVWGVDAVVARGIQEIERHGWDRCVVAGDEFAGIAAARIAGARPDLVAGIALGHATVRWATEGPDSAITPELGDSMSQLLRVDYRAYTRAYTQLTKGAYDDRRSEAFAERVPQEVAIAYDSWSSPPLDLESDLRAADVPLMLVKHRDCLMWKDETYEYAVATFPEARRFSCDFKPSVSPEFAEALREFCATVAEPSAQPR